MRWKGSLLAAVLLLGGCINQGGQDDAPATPAALLQLQRSADCSGLKGSLTSAWVASLLRNPWHYRCLACDGLDDIAVGAPGAGSEAGPAPDDVSGTNLQEAGVDEADLVKAAADGTLYLAVENLLLVARGFPPASLQQTGKLVFERRASGLYLDEAAARVILVSPDYGYYPLEGPVADSVSILPPGDPDTALSFVDVADSSNPVLMRELRVDGSHIATRRSGDRLHLVSQASLALPPALLENERLWQLLEEYHGSEQGKAREALAAAISETVKSALANFSAAAHLPALHVDGGDAQPLLSCGEVYFPDVPVLTPNLLTVTSVKLDGSDPRSAAVLGNGTQVYASPQSLYLAQPSWSWWWRDDQDDRTVLHRFAIGDGTPAYTASGSVPGHTSGPFHFGEHEGYLRVATTEPRGRGGESLNNLYVLRDDGRGELAIRGKVEGYAPGERIFAVRFLGQRGYVVTFRQIDPLFTFDLSDPLAPRLAGELEIPGFSTYLHPLGEDHLLTIGRAGTAAGASNEMQLQVFDVSDLANPRRLHSYVPVTGPDTWSWSEAGYDHHAFTYYAPLGLLSIPFTFSDHRRGGELFNGFMAFDVDLAEGIGERGRVDHADLAAAAYCPTPGTDHYACRDGGFDLHWLARPRRSLVMTSGAGAWLYTVSNVGLKASPLDDLSSTTASVPFPAPDYWNYLF